MPVAIDVFSDVVCPWCFVGKRRLEKALKKLGWSGSSVRWRAFQLNPDMPRGGMDRAEYRARKFGSLDYSRQLEARVAEAGAAEGIEFHFDRIERAPNTFDAHRLVWMAGREGAQDDVVEGLFRGYFLDGRDVGDPDVLSDIARSCGMKDLLDTDAGKAEVLADRRAAQEAGISSVPSFFVQGVYAASGAQPPDELAEILKRVAANRVDIMALKQQGT